eukprot:Clim_evm2s20 gene=Clim_evmTU2s20
MQIFPDSLLPESLLGWVILAVALLNFWSLPGLYHIHVLYGLWSRRKERLTNWDEPVKHTFRVQMDDLDQQIHMNNGMYFKNADLPRFQHFQALFGTGFIKEMTFANGGEMCFFHRQLNPYQQYDVLTDVLDFDEKWFYCRHRFMVKGQVYATIIVYLVMKEIKGKLKGKTIPPSEVLERFGHDPKKRAVSEDPEAATMLRAVFTNFQPAKKTS